MPQYELMYLLGAQVADTDIPQVTEQIKKFVADLGGSDVVETQLGKKKLAYPIKKTRNGYYVTVNFAMESKNVNALDAKIHAQEQTIIRYLIINLEEHLARMAKDKVVQEKIGSRRSNMAGAMVGESLTPAAPETPVKKRVEEKPTPATAPAPLVEINQEELDKRIEQALSEDITK
jgi:small subunit ribosomal protein S6